MEPFRVNLLVGPRGNWTKFIEEVYTTYAGAVTVVSKYGLLMYCMPLAEYRALPGNTVVIAVTNVTPATVEYPNQPHYGPLPGLPANATASECHTHAQRLKQYVKTIEATEHLT